MFDCHFARMAAVALLLAAVGEPSLGSEAGLVASGELAGGQQLRIAIPDARENLYLVLAESGVDLVVERPDLGEGQFANLPGRRWGHQVQVAWVLPPSVDHLVIRPLLDQAPSGTYQYAWYELEPADERARMALESLSQAAEISPARDRESTDQAIRLLERVQGVEFPGLHPAELWYRVGQLQSRFGDREAIQGAYDASLEQLRRWKDDQGLGVVLDAISVNQMRAGHLKLASQLSEEAAAAAQRAGDKYQQAIISNNRCVILRTSGDMKAAAACFGDALVAYQLAGIVEQQSSVLMNLAAAHTKLGDGHAALKALEKAIELRDVAAGDDEKLAHMRALAHLSQTQASLGRYQSALASGHDALEYAQRIGNPEWEVQAARMLAQVHLNLGQKDRAKALLESITADAARYGSVTGRVRVQLELALLEDDLEAKAAQLSGVLQSAAVAGDELTMARAQFHWALAGAGAGTEAELLALRGALAAARRLGDVGLLIDSQLALAKKLPDQADELLSGAMQLAVDSRLPVEEHELTLFQARTASSRLNWSLARSMVLRADALEDSLTLQMTPAQRYQFAIAMVGGMVSSTVVVCCLTPRSRTVASRPW